MPNRATVIYPTSVILLQVAAAIALLLAGASVLVTVSGTTGDLGPQNFGLAIALGIMGVFCLGTASALEKLTEIASDIHAIATRQGAVGMPPIVSDKADSEEF